MPPPPDAGLPVAGAVVFFSADMGIAVITVYPLVPSPVYFLIRCKTDAPAQGFRIGCRLPFCYLKFGRRLSPPGLTRIRVKAAGGSPGVESMSAPDARRVRYRMRLGFPELLVILFIVLLIFGANRLPDLAKGMGKSIKNFKDAVREGEDEKKS